MVIIYGWAIFLTWFAALAIVATLTFLATRVIRKFFFSAPVLTGIIFILLACGTALGVSVFWHRCTTLVIEIGDEEADKYVVFGSDDYTTNDGQQFKITSPEHDFYIVNSSERPMIDEMIWYGAGASNPGLDTISPHQFRESVMAPDYYPWEKAPDVLTVDQPTFVAIKLWVRFADHNYEND